MRPQIDKFAGMMPAIDAFSLPAAGAIIAENCLLTSGALRPLRASVNILTLAKTPTIKTVYLQGSDWWHWRELVSVVKAPDAGDQTGRTLFTFDDGSDTPKVTDTVYATSGGGTAYPINAYELGVPAPDTAPFPTLGGTNPAESDTLDTRTYIITYVNAWGHEGGGSPISLNVDVGPQQYVDLSNLGDAPPAGNYNITHKRIYRTSSGNETADFLFVAEIPVAQDTYSDNIATENLGDVWTTQDYDMPPADLKKIISLPNGIIAGISKNEICFSEPGLYYAWPLKYRIQVEGTPVALGAFGGSFAILMADGFPYMATGDVPENYTAQRLEEGQACVGHLGVIDIGYGIAYPGPDGLQIVGVGINKNATEGIIEARDWKDLNPSSFIAGVYQGAYIAFYTSATETKALMLAPGGGGLVKVDLDADCVYVDRSENRVYYVLNDTLYRFDSDSQNDLTYTWQSRPVDLTDPINLGVAQVLARSYPLTFTLDFGASEDTFSTSVTSREPFKLPGGLLYDRVQIKLEGTSEVIRVTLAETEEELATGG